MILCRQIRHRTCPGNNSLSYGDVFALPTSHSLRSFYRRLPTGLRLSIGRVILPFLEAHYARQMPSVSLRPPAMGKSAILLGLFNSGLGHATAAHLCAVELERAGIRIGRIDATRAVRAGSSALPSDGDFEGDLIVLLNPQTMVHALHALGSGILCERRVIGYWVWELSRAPDDWRRLCDPLVHEIWAPSQFAADALTATFERPVRVVPHPSALAPPPEPTQERRRRGRGIVGVSMESFVALTSFSTTSSIERKNPLAAIRAFDAAFAGDSNAHLIVRCINAERYPAAAKRLKRAVSTARSNVHLIGEGGGVEDLFDLYAACDVYISLHRSEGFGLNLAEAMLCGRPVIATGWSGNMDFMNEDCAALAPPLRLTSVRDPQQIYRQSDLVWAEPDEAAAAAHLRRLAAEPDARSQLGAAGAAYARARLSGGTAAEALRTPVQEQSGVGID